MNRRDVLEGSWRGSCGMEIVCVPVTRDRRRKVTFSGKRELASEKLPRRRNN